MDEEVLLHMYRKSFDAFLEAYKINMTKNEELMHLVEEMIKTHQQTGRAKYTKELERIKNL